MSTLRVHGDQARITKLRRERERLLREVERTRRDLALRTELADQAQAEIAARAGPLLVQLDARRAELAAAFEAILAAKSRSRQEKAEVRRLLRQLEAEGIVGGSHAPPRAEPAPSFDDPFVAPAAPKGAQERGPVRELFRRLALALHPDRAEEAERPARTELMKEVTRAYDTGDLARLVDLERRWAAGEAPAPSDDPAQTIRDLERTNRALRAQVNAHTREIRAIRRSFVTEVPVPVVCANIAAELEELTRLRDFTVAYRDGRLTHEAFLAGPEDEEPLGKSGRFR